MNIIESTKKETLINNEYAYLWYYPEFKIVYHRMNKFTSGKDLRHILSAGLVKFQEEGCSKWLSDDRENIVITEEDGIWVASNWTEQMMEAGWKYWALLIPSTAIAKISYKKAIDLYSSLGISVQLFDQPNDALNWLINQK